MAVGLTDDAETVASLKPKIPLKKRSFLIA
jgi:hypothetical protein